MNIQNLEKEIQACEEMILKKRRRMVDLVGFNAPGVAEEVKQIIADISFLENNLVKLSARHREAMSILTELAYDY